MHKLAILTYNNSALFELGCAVELFALARPEFANWYDSDIISLDSGPHQTTGGLQIMAKQVANLDHYETLVIPSWPTDIRHIKGEIAENIRRFHSDGKRILSFCSGAFLLASLGLLDNKRATTHWRYAEKFKHRYPNIDYVDNVLYTLHETSGGQIGCSAGSAAALDLGLEVIRQDFGQHAANRVARRLVVASHRKGGQAQYVDAPNGAYNNQFQAATQWAIAHLNDSFSIDQLARRAGMSRRTFDRKFKRAFNQTAKAWLTQQRLSLAKELLEQNQHHIETIAGLAGFDNATTMRHHFRHSLGLSPRQYRDQFAS
jgi:AraC family transcriptional activator FtrA